MSTPKRIRLSRRKGFRLPPNAVSVARPTKWGNPFRTSEHGTAARCVEMYSAMLAGYLCVTSGPGAAEQEMCRRWVLEHVAELRGKDLACWCPLDQPCHADVLLVMANAGEGAP